MKNLLIILLIAIWQINGQRANSKFTSFQDLKTRLSRQFSTNFQDSVSGNDETNVAMSLIDALQNWADALEAQISMMKTEVLESKSSNRKLSEEMQELKDENANLRGQVETLEQGFVSFKGETMPGLQEDIRIMSSSFGDFIDHFNEFSVSVTFNFTMFNESLKLINKSHATLHEVVMDDLKSKVEQNEAKMSNISGNVESLIYNASLAFFNDFQQVQEHTGSLETDLELVKKSLVSLTNETDLMRDQVLASLEVIQLEVAKDKPVLTSLNETFHQRLGIMEMNMTKLNSAVQDDLEQSMFQLNAMVTSNVNALQRQANMSISLQEQVHEMSSRMNQFQGNLDNTTKTFAISLHSLRDMAGYNSTLLQRGFFGLEKHFIEMKQKVFESQLNFVTINSTLGQLNSQVLNMGQLMANSTSAISTRLAGITETSGGIQDSLASLWNVTQFLDMKVQKLHSNHSLVSGKLDLGLQRFESGIEQLQNDLFKTGNKSSWMESGLSGLFNYTIELEQNMHGLSLNLSRVNASLSNMLKSRIDQVFTITEVQGKQIISNAQSLKENVTNLSLAANILEAELSRIAAGFQNMKKTINSQVSYTGNIEGNVQKLLTESVFVKSELDSLRFDIAGVKAETTGVNVFVNTMQKHIGQLTMNMTMMNQNLTLLEEHMENVQLDLENMDGEMNQVQNNVTTIKGNLDLHSQEMDEVQAGMGTMKNNVVSLGSYINTINSDLGSMLTSFDNYAKKVNTDLAHLKSNLTDFNDDMSDLKSNTEDTKKKMDSMEYSTTTLRADVTELTTKMYNLKTTGFEHSNELSQIKSTSKGLQTSLDAILKELSKLRSEEDVQNLDLQTAQTDLNRVKSAMTTLSASILELKSQVATSQVMDQKMAFLYTNITTIRTQLTTIRETLSSIGPEMDAVHSDMNRFKNDVNGLTSQVSVLRNPARFSCAVTTDEIRDPGVITYSTCNVNSGAMMNQNTGHISIQEAGDYYLSFTANMVSVNSQAIWCAIYVQSPGSEGWQVLGMINNYQRDAGTEDDRDSGTISLIASLKAGDQVWVEWRGYGDSFLYSNPYRLISFTGFLLRGGV